MKLMTDRRCAANDSRFLLPSWSASPNAYCASLVENKTRASANVIHPRSSGGNADRERVSVALVVPSSFMASGGAATSAPNSFTIRLIIPILKTSRGLVVAHDRRLEPAHFGKSCETGMPRARRENLHARENTPPVKGLDDAGRSARS